MICPVCDYPRVSPKYRMKDRFFGAVSDEFILYHCRSCGLLFLKEEEVRSRIAEFYPPGYWWSGTGGLSPLEKRYREWIVRRDQLRFVRSVAPEKGRVQLLDIGCGTGTLVAAAAAAGYDAYGLENSPEACRIARQIAPGRIIQGQESDLFEKGRQFDVLTLFHALEHIPQPFQYLKNLQKLVRRPGKLIVQVPNNKSWQAGLFRSRWYGLDCPRHLYNYNPYALMHLLGRAGFRVHRIRHFSLRDNAAALVSSLFPFLDPMSQRVKLIRRKGRAGAISIVARELAYLPLFVLAQPFAWLEARFGRGGSLTVYATLEDKLQ